MSASVLPGRVLPAPAALLSWAEGARTALRPALAVRTGPANGTPPGSKGSRLPWQRTCPSPSPRPACGPLSIRGGQRSLNSSCTLAHRMASSVDVLVQTGEQEQFVPEWEAREGASEMLQPTCSSPVYRRVREVQGTWGAQSVKCLPSAQVMIPGSWDRVPHWAPCSVGRLLLLLPLPLLVLSLSVK